MRSFDYPGSSAHFRAFMESIVNALDNGQIIIGKETRLWIEYADILRAPAREAWYIYIAQSGKAIEQRATIIAYETLPESCEVDIYDGTLYSPIGSGDSVSMFPSKAQEIGKPLDDFVERITKKMNYHPAPVKPKSTKLDDWFKYYYACRESGLKYTLKEMASDTGYSEDYVRQKHGPYKSEHGIT